MAAAAMRGLFFFTCRWYHDNPWKVAAVATVPPLLGGGAVIAAVADAGGYLETVPYTNRTHLVLRSPLQDHEHAESCFALFKEKNARFILDPHHPDAVRVDGITSRLVQAVHGRLLTKQRQNQSHADTAVENLKKKLGNARRPAAAATTEHLDGLNWEAMVVRDKRVTAWCFPAAGKIVVPTGLLDFFGKDDDAQLATMISHEIAHIVARHWAEKLVYRKWLPTPLRVPFLRRYTVEREADHIGIMLLGAAGFDPRVVPTVLEKLEEHSNRRRRRFLSTHPSNKKRSQVLSQAKIMEEALELYREAVRNDDQAT